MAAIFFALFGFVTVALIFSIVKARSFSVIFTPWPGFPFLFSSYFAAGTLSLSAPVKETQWLLYCLAILGFTVGSALCAAVWRQKNYLTGRPDRDKLRGEFLRNYNSSAVYMIAAFSIACTIYMMAKSGIPALSDNVDAARVAYLDNGYIATIASLLDVSAVLCFAYICARGLREIDGKIIASICVIALFVAVAILAGSRTRLLKFVVPAILIYNYFVRPFGWKGIAAAAASLIAFIGRIGYYRNITLY